MVFFYSATSFMIKSTTFSADQAREHRIVETSHSILDNASRDNLLLDGGRCVLSVAASINILYLGATIGASSIVLPFKSMVDDLEVLFDEVEPSPVFESGETDLEAVDKCSEVVPSFSESPSGVNDEVLTIEASTSQSFSVKVTAEEKGTLLLECVSCNGYTSKKLRCMNKRKILGSKNAWCYHHETQEQEYKGFQMYGDRPAFCSWWEEETLQK